MDDWFDKAVHTRKEADVQLSSSASAMTSLLQTRVFFSISRATTKEIVKFDSNTESPA